MTNKPQRILFEGEVDLRKDFLWGFLCLCFLLFCYEDVVVERGFSRIHRGNFYASAI